MEQADLFGGLSGNYKQPKANKSDFLSRYIVTLRLDQALIGVMILLAGFVLVFSFGVEKGKTLAGGELKALQVKYDETVTKLGPHVFSTKSEFKAPQEAVSDEIIETIHLDSTSQESDKKTAEKPAPGTTPAEALTLKTKGLYTIQMVTYNTEKAAHKLVEKLTAKGHQTYLIPSGKYIQVCLESFESKTLAKKALSRFKGDRVIPADAYIRTFPK